MHNLSKDFISKPSNDYLEQETADKSRSSSIVPAESLTFTQTEPTIESPLFKPELKKQILSPILIENITEEFHSEPSENCKAELMVSFLEYSDENTKFFVGSPKGLSQSASLEYSKTDKSSTIFEAFSSAYGYLKSVPQSPRWTDGSHGKSFETFDPRAVVERKDLGELMKMLKEIEAEVGEKEEREENKKEDEKEEKCFCVKCSVF